MSAEGCGIGIIGLGVGLPATVRRNEDWAEPPHVGAAARESGVDPFRGSVERRVIAPGQDVAELEIEACREALERAGRPADDVAVLIGSSITPTWLGPNNHARVARGLGLGRWTTALSLDTACSAFLPQIEIGARLLDDRSKCSLLYQSSAISRTLDYQSPLAPMVGDGAAAQVIGPVPDGLGLVGVQHAIHAETSEGLILGRTDGRPWTDPGEGGSKIIVMASDLEEARTVMQHSPEWAREVCERLLRRHGQTAADIDFFACTQPAADFADEVAAGLGLPEGHWLPPAEHFERYGHPMQASVTLNLYLAWRSGRLRVGDLVLAYSQGAGLTLSAALMRWAVPPPG